jgi:hypothetical protein
MPYKDAAKRKECRRRTYERQRQKEIAAALAWKREHPERARKTQKRYADQDPDHQVERTMQWRASNPGKAEAYNRRWREQRNAENSAFGLMTLIGEAMANIDRRPDPEMDCKTDDELIGIIKSCLDVSTEKLVLAARALASWERRGNDAGALRLAMTDYLRRISGGQLLAGLVVRFMSKPLILRLVKQLPIIQQQRIMDAEAFEFVVTKDNGEYDVRKLRPDELQSQSQLHQLFNGDVRTVAQQIAYLQEKRESKRRVKTHKTYVRPNHDANAVYVGKRLVQVSDFIQAASHLSSPETSEPKSEQASVKLTVAEKERLRTAAAKAGPNVTANELIRNALKAFGLI